jgi:hypothetical protein
MTKGRRRRARRKRGTLVAFVLAFLAGSVDPRELFAADAGAGPGGGEAAPHADCASADDCARMHGAAPAQTVWACESATCVLRDAPEAAPPQPPAPPPAQPPAKSRRPKREPARPSRPT